MPIGRISGVRIKVHWAFALLIAGAGWWGSLREVAVLAAVLTAHELAHLIVARGYGVEVEELEFLPFGAVIRLAGEIEEAVAETSVALAGPLSNLTLAGVAYLMGQTGIGSAWDVELTGVFLRANVGMALFNLLPAYPLDGGRVAKVYLARRTGMRDAARTTAAVGRSIGVMLFAGGIAALYLGLVLPTAILLGFFLWSAASREEHGVMYSLLAQIVKKRNKLLPRGVMPVHELAVGPDTPLTEVIKHFLSGQYHSVVVLGDSLRPIGHISEAEAVRVMSELGPHTTAREALAAKEK